MEQNKKPPQAAGTASEDNNKYKRIKNLNWSIRNFINVLLLIALPFSIYAALDTLAKNKEISELNEERRQLNIRYEILIDSQEDLYLEMEQMYLQKVENNKRLNDVINRLNLQLDQLDSQ